MVGGQQPRQTGRGGKKRGVGERQPINRGVVAAVPIQQPVEGDAPESDKAAQARQEVRDLGVEKAAAGGDFGWEWFVVRRGAAADRADQHAVQGQAVVKPGRAGLVGKTSAVQRSEKKIARGIAGEHATGAV